MKLAIPGGLLIRDGESSWIVFGIGTNASIVKDSVSSDASL